MEKVTGIGGLFFRAKNPEALSRWYRDHLGIALTPSSYDDEPWRQEAGITVFAPFPESTDYFGAPQRMWMVNFRVRDLAAMTAQLEAAGIAVAVDPNDYPNGLFARIHDPEGNAIELWEPRGGTRSDPTTSEAGSGGEDRDVEVLRSTEQQRLQALVTGDVQRAAELHTDDFQLINPLGGALSKDQYLGGVGSGQIRYLSWEPESIAVRLHGDVAVIRYRSQLEIVVQGRHIPRQRYWHTDLYERHEGAWQVVWSHATTAES